MQNERPISIILSVEIVWFVCLYVYEISSYRNRKLVEPATHAQRTVFQVNRRISAVCSVNRRHRALCCQVVCLWTAFNYLQGQPTM